MNYNAKKMFKFYLKLYNKIYTNNISNECNTIITPTQEYTELLFIKAVLDPKILYLDFKYRQSPRKYIKRELNWYLNKTLDVSEMKDIKVWNDVSDINNEVNSNYGTLVFSRNNFNQYDNVIKKLKEDKYSRQGIIIYTRPSIHYESDSFNVKDFICTNFQHFFIRNNQLITITNMRSEDAIYGTFNDIPWFHYVINKVYTELKKIYKNLELGNHIFTVNSFHIYKRHYKLLKNIIEKEGEHNEV